MLYVTAKVIHFLWLGNTLADYFNDVILNFACEFQIINFEDIPTYGRIISNLDKQGTPHIKRIM